MRRGWMVSLGLALASTGALQATTLYPWPAEPTVIDAMDDATSPGGPSQDILGIWHASDSMYHYFRMDLAAAPVSTVAGGAEIYGIYIDSATRDGGGSHANFAYVPPPLEMITHILDSHLSETGGYEFHHYHIWSLYAGPFSFTDPDAHQESANGGTTLEWKVDKSDIGDEFTMWGASITQGQPSTTHDITAAYVVPEPSTATLIVVMALGLACRSRRR